VRIAMKNVVPNRSFNSYSDNTQRIIAGVQATLEEAATKKASESLEVAKPINFGGDRAVRLSFAQEAKTEAGSPLFVSQGMGLYKRAVSETDYGSIWKAKEIEDPSTGKKEMWLVTFMDDEEELIRHVANESMQKVASIDKTAVVLPPQAEATMNTAIAKFFPNISDETKEKLRSAIAEDYIDDDISKLAVNDVVEIFQGSLFYTGDEDPNDVTASKKTAFDEGIEGDNPIREPNIQALRENAVRSLKNDFIREITPDTSDVAAKADIYFTEKPTSLGIKYHPADEHIFKVMNAVGYGAYDNILMDNSDYWSSQELPPISTIAGDMKDMPIAPGIKSKNITIDETGAGGTAKVTVEFTDPDQGYEFYNQQGGVQAPAPAPAEQSAGGEAAPQSSPAPAAQGGGIAAPPGTNTEAIPGPGLEQ
jgi:hypothetical protein